MFLFYITLRLRILIRILGGLGIFRSLILLLFFFVAVAFLFKIRREWVIPVVCLLLIEYYHNHRKDKYFLKQYVPNVNMFLCKEYCLLSTPLILLELSKGYWIGGICMLFIGLLIPSQKSLDWHAHPLKLKFLYVGSLEYIRMFRRCWLVYLFLFIFSLCGVIHDNIRIAKVCMIFWGVIQANAYYAIPYIDMVMKFKNNRTLQKMMWESNLYNVMVTYVPFIILMVACASQMTDILFLVFTIISCLLYLQSMCLLHFVCEQNITLLLVNCGFLLPVFFSSCFLLPLSIILGVCICILAYMLSEKMKSVWN